jgi:ankyrin repeat protein
MLQLRCGVRVGSVLVMLLIGNTAWAGDLALLDAAQDGDYAALQSLLKGKGKRDVNSARGDGTTALAWAAYNNDEQAVDLLIRSGADVNIADDLGVSPLSLACENGNPAMVKKLLEAGANPDLPRTTGVTPLMICANVGATDAVMALLQNGVNVNARETKDEQSALMWAVAERHSDIVKMLVDHGADIHAHSKLVPEPEPYVIKLPAGRSVWGGNYPATVRFAKVSGGFNPLHFAAQQGDVESARILLDAGADINSPHPEHGSPLIIAIASGHEALATFLLDKGADPNITDAWGVAPLHFALHNGVLFLNGFRPSAVDRPVWKRPDMVKLVNALLDQGADPNVRIKYSYPYLDNPFMAISDDEPPQIDPVGATPLLIAAAAGNMEAMEILEEVSDVKATTTGGATLFMLASGAGAERGARSEKEAIEAAKLALTLGGSVTGHLTEPAPDGPAKGVADGRTALHFAVTVGWLDMTRFLVENGADINAKDRYGMTPLMLALGDPEGRYYRNIGDGDYDHRYRRATNNAGMNEDKEMVELLLELGAEPFTGKYRDMSGQ